MGYKSLNRQYLARALEDNREVFEMAARCKDRVHLKGSSDRVTDATTVLTCLEVFTVFSGGLGVIKATVNET